MRGTLTSIKKVKEPLLKEKEFFNEETSKTSKDLKIEKRRLLKEVKKLGDIFFELKKGVELTKEGTRNYATQRLKIIENIGKEINDNLQKETETLKEKSKELDRKI